MNLPLPSGLADENLASRIQADTEGLIGRITGLLDRALLLAIERKENCITRQTLHDVYSRIFNVTDSGLNPFSAGDQPEPSRSEEHTSELQSLMRISYAVFCLKKKKKKTHTTQIHILNKHINTKNK